MKSIYDQNTYDNLENLNGIKLTIREIDIISCILYCRSEKKIAQILTISPHTVSTHVSNILKKYKIGSKESIIDLVDQSETHNIFSMHYKSLVRKYKFSNYMHALGTLMSPNSLEDLHCILMDPNRNNKKIIDEISHYLKIAQIRTLQNIDKTSNNSASKTFFLYFPTHEITDKSNNNTVYIKQFIKDVKNDTKVINIDNTEKIEKSFNNDTEHINVCLKSESEFHLSILSIIRLLNRGSTQLKKYIDKLQTEIESFETNDSFLSILKDKEKNTLKEKKVIELNNIFNNSRQKKFVLLLCISCLLGIIFFSMTKYSIIKEKIIQYDSIYAPKNNFDNLEAIIEDCAKNFTTKVMFPEHRYKNEEFKKLSEDLLHKIKNDPKYTQYMVQEIHPYYLLNYINLSQAIGVYHLYINHNQEKAREELFFCKDLVEKYLFARNKVKIDFDSLISNSRYQNLYSELSILQYLPELFNKIIYQIARSYMYDSKTNHLREAEKYFKSSKYIGNKLNMFEGYMSDMNGLGIILNKKIETDIEAGNLEQAKAKLPQLISLYKKLRKDKKEYLGNYKTTSYTEYTNRKSTTNHNTRTTQKDSKETRKEVFEIIVPSKNLHLQIECSMRILKAFSHLLEVTISLKNPRLYALDIQKYVDNIVIEVLGYIDNDSKDGNNIEGLLNLMNYSEVPLKKKAKIHNILAEIFLKLALLDGIEVDKLNKFKDKVIVQLNIDNELSNNMQSIFIVKLQSNKKIDFQMMNLAYTIFQKAEGFSREIDFTKADSNDGMARVLKSYLDNINTSNQDYTTEFHSDLGISKNHRENIRNKITEYEKTRDKINKNINRMK